MVDINKINPGENEAGHDLKTKIRVGEKAIRHREENTTEEMPGLLPWKVTLKVIRCDYDIEPPYNPVYYVRAPNHEMAAYLANRMWTGWEKSYFPELKGKPWPDTLGDQIIESIGEEDYFDAWKFAQKLTSPAEADWLPPFKSPTGFTFWEKGRDAIPFYQEIITKAKFKVQ